MQKAATALTPRKRLALGMVVGIQVAQVAIWQNSVNKPTHNMVIFTQFSIQNHVTKKLAKTLAYIVP